MKENLVPANRAMLGLYSRVRLCTTLWTLNHQAPLSIGFPKQEHWTRLPLPSPTYITTTAKENLSIHQPQHKGWGGVREYGSTEL